MLQRVQVNHMDVFSAEDGEQAVQIAQAERPDVILLDLLLPKMDGNEVCRRLHQIADYQPYIIMLTARGQFEDREQARALGVNQFMTKPFSPSRLIADLNALWAAPR
jgi:two-component system alkaline phosphatase synthesis response regulator PhoP